MPRPATGRRADSLFDNRFRYDHIYPRGRSGETLRAYDTQDNDRPVVVKRPAPQDAPPMRAGQEVSILNEKRALERLAGHPVLTELRHSGTFRVGGQTHQYIAVDLAEGVTIEDYVLDLGSRGERMPDLETLVILDMLLDLLQTAHEHKIVYNDVDAKHLFWDRAHYRLKVIDWGNAVFLDIENPHATRAADVFQAAELLHFMLSGGRRLEIDRKAGGEVALVLPDELSTRLKSILQKATATESSARYQDVVSFRRELAEVRRPLEKTRDQIVDRVKSRLGTSTTQEQFEQLLDMLKEAIKQDPGYPLANDMISEVQARLRQLSIQGDLDAARIYIESGNPGRAVTLLSEVKSRLGESDQPLLLYLIDVAEQLERAGLSRPPAGLNPALDALYRGDAPTAGRALVTTPESRVEARDQQMLLAERLTLRMPGVVLLRPHLTRLDQQLAAAGRTSDRAILNRISAPLDNPVEPGVRPLQRLYSGLAETLEGFTERLADEALEACKRAARASADIADLMEIVGANVLSDPARAGNALWHAGAIDPSNPAFEAINALLNTFHAELDTIADASPGVDVIHWLTEAQARLLPYADDIADARFKDLLGRLQATIDHWNEGISAFAQGGKRPAIEAYEHAAAEIKPVNEAAARWFAEHIRQIGEARYAEMMSPNSAFGRAMADGWDAWDRGRNGDAQANAGRARDAAQTDDERAAADRLNRLAELTGAWLAGDGLANQAVCQKAEAEISALFTAAELQIQRKFADQMPNMTVYLKAMARGLVEPMREVSSAAARILMMQFTLRGVSSHLAEQPDEAEFWREAASRTLPNVRMHPAFMALENAIARRQLLITAAQAVNSVTRVEDLAAARQAVRAPLAAAQLEPAEQAFRAIEDALRRWADGDFRAAHMQLDTAQERIAQAENAIGRPLDSFKQWLADLNNASVALQGVRRQIEQAALIPTDQPDPAIEAAHKQIADMTWRQLGEEYVSLLRQWRDTYVAIRELYEDARFSRDEKLRLIEGHFASLFIDKHPAYPIYRHWQSVIKLQPDPQPVFVPTASGHGSSPVAPSYEDDSTPVSNVIIVEEPAERQNSAGRRAGAVPPREMEEPDETPAPRVPWRAALIGAALVLAVLAIAVIVISNRPAGSTGLELTLPPSATGAAMANDGATLPANAVPTNTLNPPTVTETREPSPTQTASSTPPPPTSTASATGGLVPTETPPLVTVARVFPTTPATVPPTVSPSTVPVTDEPMTPTGLAPIAPLPGSSGVPTTTLAPNARSGDYDLLDGLSKISPDNYTWTADRFSASLDGTWRLGVDDPKAGNTVQTVRIGPTALAALYGPDASRQVSRVDAVMEVVSYDKKLVATGQVYFGLGFEASSGQQRASAQINVLPNQAAAYGTNINGRFTSRSVVPASTVKLTLSARRNTDRTVSLYADGQLLGTTAAVYGPATPVSLVLYTSAQSVIVNITAMTVWIG